MHNKKQRTNLWLSAAALLFAGAVVCGTFWDLAISLAIADPACWWAIVLEIVGELPAMYFSAWNLCVLFLAEWQAKKPRVKWLCPILAFVTVGLCAYAADATLAYLNQYYGMPLPAGVLSVLLSSLCGLATAAIVFAFAMRLSPEKLETFRPIALAAIKAALIVLVTIVFIKQLWGRVRFRQLLAMGDLSAFSPWYLPQGFGDTSHVSFPSGHTSNAAVFTMLVCYFPKQKRWLLPLLLAWVALCAASRIFVGAHFLTDVLFGGAISLSICCACRPKEQTL